VNKKVRDAAGLLNRALGFVGQAEMAFGKRVDEPPFELGTRVGKRT
jgi:hypothetical protein